MFLKEKEKRIQLWSIAIFFLSVVFIAALVLVTNPGGLPLRIGSLGTASLVVLLFVLFIILLATCCHFLIRAQNDLLKLGSMEADDAMEYFLFGREHYNRRFVRLDEVIFMYNLPENMSQILRDGKLAFQFRKEGCSLLLHIAEGNFVEGITLINERNKCRYDACFECGPDYDDLIEGCWDGLEVICCTEEALRAVWAVSRNVSAFCSCCGEYGFMERPNHG